MWILSRYLALCFFCCCLSSCRAAPVFLARIVLATTHDLPLWTPEVYFKCEGDDQRKILSGIVTAHHRYNLTLHEEFQPLTDLATRQCKSCGLYEADTTNPDDVFDQWELCALDFSPGPLGEYSRVVPGQMNLTLACNSCNVVESFAFTQTASGTTEVILSPLALFGIVAVSLLSLLAFLGILVLIFRPIITGRGIEEETEGLVESRREEDKDMDKIFSADPDSEGEEGDVETGEEGGSNMEREKGEAEPQKSKEDEQSFMTSGGNHLLI